MTQTKRKLGRTLWIAAFVAVLYAGSVYNSFFAKQLGYVYDPATDRLFELDLTPSINACDKWTPLIPFKRCFLGEVGRAEYLGKLQAIEDERKLARENPKVWMENQNKKIDALLSGKPAKELASWNVNYYWTQAVPVSELLPKRLSPLKDSTTDQDPNLIGVDVVIARRTSFAKSADIEVVRSAVLIRGIAARRFVTWMGAWELDELPN